MGEKTNLGMVMQFMQYFQWWYEISVVNEITFTRNKFEFRGGSRQRLILKLSALIAWIYSGVVVLRVYSIYVDEKVGGYINNTMSVTVAVWMYFGQWIRHLIMKDSGLAAAVCNTMIRYDIKESEGSDEDRKRWQNILMPRARMYYIRNAVPEIKKVALWWYEDLKSRNFPRLAIITSAMTVLGMILLPALYLVFYPCSLHAFLRSTLSDCKRTGWMPALPATPITSGLLVLLDTYMLVTAFFQGTTYFVILTFPLVIAMADHTSRILDGAKRSSIGLIKRGMKKYSELQLLNVIYNQLHCGGLVSLLLAEVIYLGIGTEFVLIGLHSTLPMAILLVNGLIWINVIVVLCSIYQKAGDVNDLSAKLLSSWKYNRNVTKDKYLRRLSRSMQPLKIRIGMSGNYFEKITPLNLNQFSLDQAISLVLLSRSK